MALWQGEDSVKLLPPGRGPHGDERVAYRLLNLRGGAQPLAELATVPSEVVAPCVEGRGSVRKPEYASPVVPSQVVHHLHQVSAAGSEVRVAVDQVSTREGQVEDQRDNDPDEPDGSGVPHAGTKVAIEQLSLRSPPLGGVADHDIKALAPGVRHEHDPVEPIKVLSRDRCGEGIHEVPDDSGKRGECLDAPFPSRQPRTSPPEGIAKLLDHGRVHGDRGRPHAWWRGEGVVGQYKCTDYEVGDTNRSRASREEVLQRGPVAGHP